jgi:adenosine deaminase
VPDELEVRIFAGMLRADITGELRPTVDQLHTWEGLAGVDLHGHEVAPTPPETAAIWAKMRAVGKVTKCHAGEFDGAARVREAIEVLGVRRIQHGVRAIEDPVVMKLAADTGTTFDVCPISNVGLRVVPSLQDHPIRRLMRAGIRCTVSTDDPLCFANSITEEYEALANELTFTGAELAQVARNGWEVADVAAEVRKTVLGEIDRIGATAT